MHPVALLLPLIGTAFSLLSEEEQKLPHAQLVSLAGQASGSGQYSRAIDLYDAALEQDTSDYLSLYKRSTAYLASGQSKRASEDLEAVLKISKDFDSARVQLARMRLRAGEFASAAEHLDLVSSSSDSKTLKQNLKSAESSYKAAQKAHSQGKWDKCISEATAAIDVASQSYHLRELRADCTLEAGQFEEGTADLMRAASLNPSSQDLLHRLALLNYVLIGSDISLATQPLKQCLHYDPDSRVCKPAFRQLKAFDKELRKATNYVESSMWSSTLALVDPTKDRDTEGLLQQFEELMADNLHVLFPSSPSSSVAAKRNQIMLKSGLYVQLLDMACKAHVKASSSHVRSQPVCSRLAQVKPKSAPAALFKAQELMRNEEFEAAVRTLQDAFEESGRSDRELMDELQKAQARMKRSKSKDYYKVLNVSPDADDKTIKRGYRKAVIKAHPDKGGSEAQMAAVNEAYEVLSNPELRARFDKGDDPNDPSSGHPGGGGSPFTGSPFSSGGFPGGFGGHGEKIFQQFFQGGSSFHSGGGSRGGPFGGGSRQQYSFKFGV